MGQLRTANKRRNRALIARAAAKSAKPVAAPKPAKAKAAKSAAA
jgi:hypothetical protein